ncbi:MarR family transcriptional regulator [Streptomyces parvulus]|uniref:MarR family transcriptional regulator n=1 Tax=Streptomyces parvulus TaxID=146923 RepID=A0A369V4Q0_9ACTN|nr:MarR family transcriptional regulator [Streptomyces parvulus]
MLHSCHKGTLRVTHVTRTRVFRHTRERPLSARYFASFTRDTLGDRQRGARLPPAAVPGRRRGTRGEVRLVTDRRLWSYKDIATHIRVQPDTVRSYRKHGLLPPPDHVEGGKPYWYAETIRAWVASRPSNRKR